MEEVAMRLFAGMRTRPLVLGIFSLPFFRSDFEREKRRRKGRKEKKKRKEEREGREESAAFFFRPKKTTFKFEFTENTQDYD